MNDTVKAYANFISSQVNEGKVQITEGADGLSANQKKHLFAALNSHSASEGDTEDDAHVVTLKHLDKAINDSGAPGAHKGFDGLSPKVQKHLASAMKSHKAAGGDTSDDPKYVKTLSFLDKAAGLN